jgi:NADP-dependent 3-hydroxy acid dehydrogenase YdfG
MVDLKGVRHSNQSLAALQPSIVAVFAGATAGIGLGTLTQFTKHTNAPVVFIVGRSEEKGREIVDRLKNINPKGTFHFIQAQFSLLREVDRVSVEIKKLTTHVDILYLSTGYLTFEGRKGLLLSQEIKL